LKSFVGTVEIFGSNEIVLARLGACAGGRVLSPKQRAESRLSAKNLINVSHGSGPAVKQSRKRFHRTKKC